MSIRIDSVHADPSAETLKTKSVSPASPTSARPENPLWKRSEAVSPSASLLTTNRTSPVPPSPASRPVKSTALERTASRLVASAVALTPKRFTAPRKLPTATQSPSCRTSIASAAASKAIHPGRAAMKSHAPSTKAAISPSCPAHAPVAPAATMYRSPSSGLPGGAVSVVSITASCTTASSRVSASLWVTCFCACAAAR